MRNQKEYICRGLIIALFTGVLALARQACGADAAAADQPNIVFILADDMAWHGTGTTSRET